jgi:hypothetical protein
MSLNHPSAYLPGGPPASTPLGRLWYWKAQKKQDYQETIPLNLSTLSKEEKVQETLSQRLGMLNQRSLQTNLRTLLTRCAVPVLGIEKEIPSLIKLRNEIVHRGHKAESGLPQPLSYYTAVLRELLTRIFLSLLQYKGEYQSYLNGPEWKKFPPTEE